MTPLSSHKQLSPFLSLFTVFGLVCSLTFFGTPPAMAEGSACDGIFTPPQRALRSYQDIKELKIMTFNVENLFWSTGKTQWTSSSSQHRDFDRNPAPKPEVEIENIRSIISEESPDFAILTEVESLLALQHLAQSKLKGKYNSFLIEGNDPRGIDIGFLMRADLPFSVKEETHKDMMWFDPVDKKEVKLFSRDLPVLLLSKSPTETPFLIVMGTHAKSKRDRPGDPESTIWRQAQNEGIAKLIASYKEKYKGVPMILGGDFNSDVNEAPELKPILSLLKSSFKVAKTATPEKDRITHTYHPRGAPAEWSQMDDIKVSADLAPNVEEARVYRYRNSEGKILPFARTVEERQKQPSDHLPVIMRISTEGLFDESP